MTDLITRWLFIFIINYYLKTLLDTGLTDPAENGMTFTSREKKFPVYILVGRILPFSFSNREILRGE